MSSKNYYISGNTVRELEAQPIRRERKQEREELERIRRRKIRRNAARRNREKAMFMSRGTVVFLSICVMFTALAASGYIAIQSQLGSRNREISALEIQINDLKAENDARYKSISTSVDIDHIKDVAINELGMSYPSKKQIKYYSVDKTNFMDQYQDIPEQ